ncbi:MAG: hypothetical protein ACMUEM_05025 [Flavobacteriales bacterium AspAUS03]
MVALHTLGHTLESTTYLLKDFQVRYRMLFTGDIFFIGEVVQPDLAANASLS